MTYKDIIKEALKVIGASSTGRVILLDGDYWKVLEYPDRWELCKYAVSISYYKPNPAETYSQFTDRLIK